MKHAKRLLLAVILILNVFALRAQTVVGSDDGYDFDFSVFDRYVAGVGPVLYIFKRRDSDDRLVLDRRNYFFCRDGNRRCSDGLMPVTEA